MNVRGHRVCSSLSLESECQQRLARLLSEQQDWFSKFHREPSSFKSSYYNGDFFSSEPSLEKESFYSEFTQRTQRFSHLIRRSGVNAELFRSLSHRPHMLSLQRADIPSPFLSKNVITSSSTRDSSNAKPLLEEASSSAQDFAKFQYSSSASVSFPNLKQAELKSLDEFLSFSNKCLSFNQMSFSSNINNMSVSNHSSLSFKNNEECDPDFELASESEDDESTEEAISGMPSDAISVHSERSLLIPEDKERHQHIYKIALEMVSTEQTYVSILYLLDQVFAFRVDQENRMYSMFPQEVLSQMFSILKSLYKLHHDFLLPQLEERISSWESEPRIGDIMKNFAPFLKMYTDYVKNYDNSMHLIQHWYQKEPRFAQIMDDIHSLPECGHLTIQHHMLTPVQRIPRYELLLKDYLRKLYPDSPDHEDTKKALELVSLAANHANDAMKKIDKFRELIELQEKISGVVDLASPTRELLYHGKIGKISARTGDHQDRHLFLFSDLVLVCSPIRRLVTVSGNSHFYRMRVRLDIDQLEVEEGHNLDTPNSFFLHSPFRSIELYTQTSEEKLEWIQLINKAILELREKKSSLRVAPMVKDKENVEVSSSELGKMPPHFVKQDSVHHCQVCQAHFNAFKRKHHCRACGKVCCAKCLGHKVALEYDGHRSGKVCAECHTTLKIETSKGADVLSPPLPAAVQKGYLSFKAHLSRSWVTRWFALHPDFVLYSFRTHTDERALTSMPVPGYEVVASSPDLIFKLCHKKRIYFFQATEKSDFSSWVNALEKASRAETL